MAPRLTSDFWVGAYLARLSREGVFAHIVRKGDPTAGAIAVKVATMRGQAALFMRSYDGEGNRVWTCLIEDTDERDVDEAIERQLKFDRDLWVVEVEDPRGRHFLDDNSLS